MQCSETALHVWCHWSWFSNSRTVTNHVWLTMQANKGTSVTICILCPDLLPCLASDYASASQCDLDQFMHLALAMRWLDSVWHIFCWRELLYKLHKPIGLWLHQHHRGLLGVSCHKHWPLQFSPRQHQCIGLTWLQPHHNSCVTWIVSCNLHTCVIFCHMTEVMI